MTRRTTKADATAPARELRFAFVFHDYDAAVHLFRHVFGLETLQEFDDENGRGVLLHVPSATLEVFDRAYGAHIDDIEVGRPLDYRVRIAVNIDELAQAGRELQEAGASRLSDPVDTPWGDRNQRFTVDDDLQLTLFQSPR